MVEWSKVTKINPPLNVSQRPGDLFFEDRRWFTIT